MLYDTIQNYSNKSIKANIREEVKNISQWVKIKYRIDNYSDNFFENFLLCCNNDVPLCKQKICKYFSNKKYYSQYLQAGDLNDKEYYNFCSSVFSMYLPKMTRNNYRIFVEKVTDDERLYDVFKIIKYFCMQTDLRYLEEEHDNGDVILFDCNNLSGLKFVAFIPYFIKSLILLLEVYPLRLKLLVLINVGKTMEVAINVLKTVLFPHFGDTIYAYAGGHENFFHHLDAEVLPREYNGKLASMEEIRNNWIRKLKNYNEWFAEVNHKINISLLEDITDNDDFIFENLQID